MVSSSRPSGSASPTLVRLVARLAGGEAPANPASFSEPLSHWLGWADAISLASVLNEGAIDGAAPGPARRGKRPDARAVLKICEKELLQVRAALAESIDRDPLFAAAEAAPARALSDREAFAPYRRRHAARQQAMTSAIEPLRARLRSALAEGPKPMARLAALDAVMEQALAAEESRLLGSLPGWLEKRFCQLRKTDRGAEIEIEAEAQPDVAVRKPQPWLEQFAADMQAMLLAELDCRLQPVEGLLEALRTSQPKAP
ncbi:conserved hypothetical protein [Burkholderiales bacterium 8X]|nr:conserved hypothetical protein [Burkholderiales bacterium 8X]